MYQNEVSSALEILLEEIETIIDELDQEGSRNFSLSKHKEARLLLDKAEASSEFRAKVKELQGEWSSLEVQISRKTPAELKEVRRSQNRRLQRGLRTPEEDFTLPILEALTTLGGKAPSTEVLNQIEKIMENIFNEYDRQPLFTTPSSPRWRNTAQWARNGMVNEGLLSKDSSKGIWEITEAGKELLMNLSGPEADSQWEMEGSVPKGLYQILKVYEYVSLNSYDYNSAVARVAEEQGLMSIHTVYDACTRRINLNTEQFRRMLENPHRLSDYLSTLFPNYGKQIAEAIPQ